VDSKPKFSAEQILKYTSEGGELFIFSMPSSDLNTIFGGEDNVAVLPVRKVYETGKRGSLDYLDFFLPSVDYDVLVPSTQASCVASIMTDCVGWKGDSIYFYSVDPFDVRQYILDIASRAEKKTIYALFYRDSFRLNQELYAKPGHFINDREPIRIDNQYYMWLKTNMQKLTSLAVGGSNNVMQYYTVKTQGALPIVETASSVVNEYGAVKVIETLKPLSMKTIEAKIKIKVYDDAKTDNVRVSLVIPFNPSSIKWVTPSGIQAGAFGNMVYPTAILESGNSKVLISVIHDDAFVSKTITHNYNTIYLDFRVNNGELKEGEHYIILKLSYLNTNDYNDVINELFKGEELFDIEGFSSSDDRYRTYSNVEEIANAITKATSHGKRVILLYDMSYLPLLKKLNIKYSIREYKDNYYILPQHVDRTLLEKDGEKLATTIRYNGVEVLLLPKFLDASTQAKVVDQFIG